MFDEPALKWSKLLAQVSKLLKNGPPDIEDEPLSVQQDLFCEVFGGNQESIASRIFNLVLALEDIERFDDSCFFNWSLSSKVEAAATRAQPAIVGELSSYLSLNEGGIAWLEHACRATPDWTAVLTPGCWSSDVLAQFVIDCLQSPSSTINVENVLAMRAKFKSSVAQRRKQLPSHFQPNQILLVEGATESILIPRFADLLKADLDALAVIPCGGANQLVRKYIALADITPMPICCLIDKDADEQSSAIKPILRDNKDALHVWSEGEIEDALGQDILLRYLNLFLSEHGNSSPLNLAEIQSNGERKIDFDRIWRTRGLGDFDKVGFARYVAQHISAEEIPLQIRQLIATLRSLAEVRKDDPK